MAQFHQYPNVFNPIQIGPVSVKNRIQFSPMVSAHADTQTGSCTPELVEYVGAQARTGAGIVTIGSTPIDFERGRDFYGCLSAWRDADTAGLMLLAAEAHRYGAKLSVELTHAGCIGEPGLLHGLPAFVPSKIPGIHDAQNVEEITEADMETLAAHWAACAKRCTDAGFDMVMVHCAHGNLLSAFLSPVLNRRTDSYGNSMEKRWRFPLRVLQAVREAVGEKKAIELRISGDERVEGAPTVDERIAFLLEAQKYINLVNISTGIFTDEHALSHMIPTYYLGHKLNVEWAAEIKKHLDIPVSVSGGITTIEEAEELLEACQADIAAMARPLIADQALVTKAFKGREDTIRPCLQCNECLQYTCVGSPVRCAVNPQAGREVRYSVLMKAPEKKKVMVIGGGPAGMTAARTLRARGHEVQLYEATARLGGRLREASSLWCKEGFRRYLNWAVTQTENCGAQLILDTKVTPRMIERVSPDVVIAAIGGEEAKPPIPGLDLPIVIGVSAADRGLKKPGKLVVVCGGGLSGSECALALAREGRNVVLVDELPEEELCTEIFRFNRLNLFELLKNYGVKRIRARVESINYNGVTVLEHGGAKNVLPADTVISAFGMKINDKKVGDLLSAIPDSYRIGDCNEIGRIFSANRSAFDLAVEI